MGTSKKKIGLKRALIIVAITIAVIGMGTACALGFGIIVGFSILGGLLVTAMILLGYLFVCDDGDCYY